jgi:hypothetical protein
MRQDNKPLHVTFLPLWGYDVEIDQLRPAVLALRRGKANALGKEPRSPLWFSGLAFHEP